MRIIHIPDWKEKYKNLNRRFLELESFTAELEDNYLDLIKSIKKLIKKYGE